MWTTACLLHSRTVPIYRILWVERRHSWGSWIINLETKNSFHHLLGYLKAFSFPSTGWNRAKANLNNHQWFCYTVSLSLYSVVVRRRSTWVSQCDTPLVLIHTMHSCLLVEHYQKGLLLLISTFLLLLLLFPLFQFSFVPLWGHYGSKRLSFEAVTCF